MGDNIEDKTNEYQEPFMIHYGGNSGCARLTSSGAMVVAEKKLEHAIEIAEALVDWNFHNLMEGYRVQKNIKEKNYSPSFRNKLLIYITNPLSKWMYSSSLKGFHKKLQYKGSLVYDLAKGCLTAVRDNTDIPLPDYILRELN